MRLDVTASMHVRNRRRPDIPQRLNHSITLFLSQQGGSLISIRPNQLPFRISQGPIDVRIHNRQRPGKFLRQVLLNLAAFRSLHFQGLLNISADRGRDRCDSSFLQSLTHLLPQRRFTLRKLRNLLIDLCVTLINGDPLFGRYIRKITVLRLLPRMRIESRLEAGHQTVVITLWQRVVFVIVTAAALQCQPQNCR